MAARQGQLQLSTKPVVQQHMGSAPILIEKPMAPGTTTVPTKTLSLRDLDAVQVREKPANLDPENEVAFKIWSDLRETGLIIKNTLFMQTSKNNEPQVFYECVSRAGDPFFIQIKMEDSSDVTYISTSDGKKSHKLVIADGQVIPDRGQDYDDCHADPLCNKIFKCNETSGACPAKGGPRSGVRFSKVVSSESSEVSLNYGDNPLAYPVISHLAYLADPAGATEKISKQLLEIQKTSQVEVSSIIKNSSGVLTTTNDYIKNVGSLLELTNKIATDNTATANKLLEQYFSHDKPLTPDQMAKFSRLQTRKLAFNTMINNIARMSKQFEEETLKIRELQVDMISFDVKLWIQSKLNLGPVSNTVTVPQGGGLGPVTYSDLKWALPESLSNMTTADLINTFAGDMTTFDAAVKTFLTAVNGSNLPKDIGLADLQSLADLTTLVTQVKERGEDVVGAKMDNAQRKIWPEIMAVLILNDTLVHVGPMVVRKLESHINKGKCTNDECLNYDTGSKKVTKGANGNIPNLGNVKSAEVNGIDLGAMNNLTDFILASIE